MFTRVFGIWSLVKLHRAGWGLAHNLRIFETYFPSVFFDSYIATAEVFVQQVLFKFEFCECI